MRRVPHLCQVVVGRVYSDKGYISQVLMTQLRLRQIEIDEL